MFKYLIRDFKDLKALQKAKDKAEELFYLDSEMVENSKKMQGILKGLIDKNKFLSLNIYAFWCRI
ncbi:TPA: hypothetical protein SFZ74_000040 [Campylobacter coli]|nr:hypothetical protein [Campylobacter coli]EDO6781536.1 hypothetical protein [Campylobacter coli]HEG8147487.1 hypothetical protein [Campylobacter coli]